MAAMQGERWDAFTIAAFIAAIVIAVLAVTLPLFGSTATRVFGTETAGNPSDLEVYEDSDLEVFEERTSLWDTQGRSVIVAVTVPAVLAAIPLVLRRGRAGRIARVVVAVLLWAYVIVSAASVGLFFIPVAFLATVAAIRGWPAVREHPAP